jgi:hypothetical protein
LIWQKQIVKASKNLAKAKKGKEVSKKDTFDHLFWCYIYFPMSLNCVSLLHKSRKARQQSQASEYGREARRK